MPDPYPEGITRADIERHIAENGVTRGVDCEWRAPPSTAETRKMLADLDDLDAAGKLSWTGTGVGGNSWRKGSFDFRRMQKRANRKSRQSNAARGSAKREKYRQLILAGKSAREIADEMECSIGNVRQVAWRLGLRIAYEVHGRADTQKRAEVKALHDAGLWPSAIAKRLGRNHGSVLKMLKAMGITPNRAPKGLPRPGARKERAG